MKKFCELVIELRGTTLSATLNDLFGKKDDTDVIGVLPMNPHFTQFKVITVQEIPEEKSRPATTRPSRPPVEPF